MLRTMIRLPDGSEIFSGADRSDVIQSVKLTECVNSAEELTIGSVCANMLEADIQTPNGGLNIIAGDEITVYKVDANDNYHLQGFFTMETPARATANTLRLTAYDRVSWLDKDLTQWLAGLTGWPYDLLAFADMVCAACGLTLVNESIPNGDHQIRAFTAQGITGRKLMQWVGEIAGRFCRATPEGEIELAWYVPSGVEITPDGDRFYFQNGLAFEDYSVAPIEKVQIKLTEDDVGAVWPDETGEKNTYIVSGNYLLTTTTTEALIPVAQVLYEHLKDVTYTPCKLQIPACADIHAGHSVTVTDRNGKTITAYVMTKTQAGQLDTLEGTGSYRRDSTTVVNNERYEAVARKTLELQKKVEGLTVTAADLSMEIQQIGDESANSQQQIQSLQESIGELHVDADSIRASISDVSSTVDGVSGEVQATKAELASLQLASDALSMEIQKINDDGVKKVTTTTGVFDETGFTVDKTDSPTKTQVTPDGMVVYKKTYSTASEVLSATSDGVDATNLHAKTYLTIGGRSRFENYGTDRTGCFWIGD